LSEIEMKAEYGAEVVERPSVAAVMESLNGFDEIAIEQRFGDLSGLSGMRTVRALQFVRIRRGGLNDKDAYNTTMLLTLGELKELFADEAPADSLEGESSAEGKDD
jgi:hypothetical protein